MSEEVTEGLERRAELAAEITAGLDDGRHYTTLSFREIGGDLRVVEVAWNHDPDYGGAGYARDDFSGRDESERHRELAIEEVGEPDTDKPSSRQTQLITDGGPENETEPVDRDRASITREHLLGATVWAYGGGAARVRPWTTARDVRMPGRLER
ncbi:hypothetical protein DJ84_02365 [Halorubrum ezzemoulense]|nr:hypothetical protein DJ84_02365 [Halorubrum ezzemoulense]